MKTLTLLLVVCAGTSAQFAQAQDQLSLAAIRAACAEDAQKLCPGVQPGGGRIVACLKEHKDSLSDRCKQAAGLGANPSSSLAADSGRITTPLGTDCCKPAFTLYSYGFDAIRNTARAIHRPVVLPREEPAQLHFSGYTPNTRFKRKSQSGITILFCVRKPKGRQP